MVNSKPRLIERTYKTRIPEWFSLLKDGNEYTVDDIIKIAKVTRSTVKEIMTNHNVPKKWFKRDDGHIINIYVWDKAIYDQLLKK